MLSKVKVAVKDSFIYSLGNVTTKLIGLVLLPIYTKELTVEQYGILGTLEITLQVLVAFFSFALYQAFNRWYWDKEYRDKQQSLFFTTLMFVIGSALFMWVLISLVAEPFSVFLLGSSNYSYLLMLMVGSSALQIIARMNLTLMRLQRKAALFSLSNVVKLAVTLVLTVYFVVYLQRGVEGIFEAQIIGFIVFFLFISRYIWKNLVFRFQLHILQEMLNFSYPLMISSIGGILFAVADKYAVRFIGGLNDIGIYSLGFKIANVLNVLVINSVLPALLPLKLRMMDQPGNKRFYSKMLTYSTFGFVFFLMALIFFGKELVVLLAQNPDYWSAYQIIPVLCFAQLFEMLRRTANFGLIIEKKTKIVSKIMLSVAAINVALNVLFIYLFDIMGAAIATLFSQALFFWVIYWKAQQHYYIPYELKKVFTLVGLVVVLSIGAYLTNSIALLPRIIIKLMMMLSLPVILYFFNFYETVELERLRGAWNKWKNPRDWRDNLRQFKDE